jgi:hypothetical protein
MLRISVVVLLLAAGPAACGSSSPTRAETVALDAEVTLAPGGAVVVKDKDVEVAFVAVTEDSRCPTRVECVWMGEVKARLSLRHGGEGAEDRELREGENATIGELRVSLVRVSPYPESSKKIAADAYRATIKVSSAR